MMLCVPKNEHLNPFSCVWILRLFLAKPQLSVSLNYIAYNNFHLRKKPSEGPNFPRIIPSSYLVRESLPAPDTLSPTELKSPFFYYPDLESRGKRNHE